MHIDLCVYPCSSDETKYSVTREANETRSNSKVSKSNLNVFQFHLEKPIGLQKVETLRLMA